MNCFNCPKSRARCLERAWRQLSSRAGKASGSSGGLSHHPAEEPRRGENVEAEAKLSEAGEETVSRRQRWKRQTRGGENPATGKKDARS